MMDNEEVQSVGSQKGLKATIYLKSEGNRKGPQRELLRGCPIEG